MRDETIDLVVCRNENHNIDLKHFGTLGEHSKIVKQDQGKQRWVYQMIVFKRIARENFRLRKKEAT